MESETQRSPGVLIWTASLLGVAVVLLRAPIPTMSALVTGGVAALISRYSTVGAMTGAVILPALVGVATGLGGTDVPVSMAVSALILYGCRSSVGRLRRGEERQIGGGFRAPFQQTQIGLWAPPAPHGLLGRSALPLGAILLIILTIGLAVIATTWLA